VILTSDPNYDRWVLQRRVYRRSNKCSWKTISAPMEFGSAMQILSPLPLETYRLMSGIEDFFAINSIQREE